ncbi:hypothetical protein Bealeia1_00424 [Candidatus Bealeia paramacronuclearis]|uniref:Uncharacterized protein n=1 Tax=Candidatus Bealeia paramacronuclearis TaxID=1921001 RepID=A0ABZ2C1J4_9PROT|nr:hypothetical protein [Candidatus Bealeia paramacronuclearis]
MSDVKSSDGLEGQLNVHHGQDALPAKARGQYVKSYKYLQGTLLSEWVLGLFF